MLAALGKWLAGGATKEVGEYFRQKQELKQQLALAKLQGQIKLEEAKALAEVKRLDQSHEWELAQIANSGYKDEVVLAVLAAPYVGAFIPVVQDYVLVGFEYLAKMPDWAVAVTVGVFLASYGIRLLGLQSVKIPGLNRSSADGK